MESFKVEIIVKGRFMVLYQYQGTVTHDGVMPYIHERWAHIKAAFPAWRKVIITAGEWSNTFTKETEPHNLAEL